MSDRAARKKNVIDALNKARAMELQAIHQYMNQHYKLDDQDYGQLAANMKLIAIDEMRHAEAFAERIVELGGEPTPKPAGDIVKGQKIKEIYDFNVEEEETAVDTYNAFIVLCKENNDILSAKLFERIIEEEQMHLTYFENISNHIKNLKDTFLSKMAGTSSSTGASKGFVINAGADAAD